MGTFTIAGFSTLNGKTKLRFANDMVTRSKMLDRNGHVDVNLVELPEAMDKFNAARFLATKFEDIAMQALIANFLEKRK